MAVAGRLDCPVGEPARRRRFGGTRGHAAAAARATSQGQRRRHRIPRLPGSLPRDGHRAWLRRTHRLGRSDDMTVAGPVCVRRRARGSSESTGREGLMADTEVEVYLATLLDRLAASIRRSGGKWPPSFAVARRPSPRRRAAGRVALGEQAARVDAVDEVHRDPELAVGLPRSCTPTMWRCHKVDARSAFRMNRVRYSWSVDHSGGSSLSASRRGSLGCWARYTSPMSPEPRSRRIV